MYNYDGFSGDKGPASITSNHYDTPSSNVAKRVWYVFNEMYDSEMANVVSSGPDEIYFIGNKIHGITEGPAFNSWGSYYIHILNNVVSNSISGLSISGGDGTHYLRLKGNIFTDFANQDYVILSNSGYSSRADISNNVFYSSMGISNVDGNARPVIGADWDIGAFAYGQVTSAFINPAPKYTMFRRSVPLALY